MDDLHPINYNWYKSEEFTQPILSACQHLYFREVEIYVEDFGYAIDKLGAKYTLTPPDVGLRPDHNKFFMQKNVVVDFGDEGKGRIVNVEIEIGDEYLVQGPSIRGHGKDFPFSLDVIFVVEKA